MKQSVCEAAAALGRVQPHERDAFALLAAARSHVLAQGCTDVGVVVGSRPADCWQREAVHAWCRRVKAHTRTPAPYRHFFNVGEKISEKKMLGKKFLKKKCWGKIF
jgi:hypothetical protein